MCSGCGVYVQCVKMISVDFQYHSVSLQYLQYHLTTHGRGIDRVKVYSLIWLTGNTVGNFVHSVVHHLSVEGLRGPEMSWKQP